MSGHAHAHDHVATGTRFRTALLLTALILIVEVTAGFAAHSLALLSDAGHVFTDIAALGLAWYATVQAQRPADAEKTFGYHRTGILAALANAVTLLLIVGAILYEAVTRLQHPEHPAPAIMTVAALVGIGINLYIGFSLQHEASDNLNVRAAMLHVFGDVGAGIGVIVGAVVIALTGWNAADPLISLLIAALIARGAWDIVRETIDVLMESTPRGLDVSGMVGEMRNSPGVIDVHDLHVWSLSGGMRVLSAHVQMDDRPLSECEAGVERLNHLLRDRYAIHHTTLQIEAGCCSRELYCSMATEHGHDHSHGASAARTPGRAV
jgi:cobalt-zinc-cadmium efflux system protein